MNPTERFADLEEAMRQALRADRATIWTTLPGIIVSFNPDAVTATVQPALQGVVQSKDGTAAAVNLPQLLDVPVQFPRGGGVTLTFPIKAGDECTVNFSARCIDGWWQSGGVQLPMEPRMHDLSDAFCTVGPQSQVKKIAGISTTAAQLRTDDGAAYVQLDPASHGIRVTTTGDVDVSAGGHVNASAGSAQVTAATINLIGAVTVQGTLAVTGLTSLNGGFAALPRAGGGASTIASDVSITGNTDTTGSLTNNGKAVGSTLRVSGVQTGGGVSGTPI